MKDLVPARHRPSEFEYISNVETVWAAWEWPRRNVETSPTASTLSPVSMALSFPSAAVEGTEFVASAGRYDT